MFDELSLLSIKYSSACDSLGEFFSLEQVYALDLNPAILKFLSSKFDEMFENEKEKFLKNFDILSPSKEIDSYFELLGSVIKNKKRIPKEKFKELINECVFFYGLFLTNPISYSIETAFGTNFAIDKKSLASFINSLYYGEFVKKTLSRAYNLYNVNGFLDRKVAEDSLKKVFAALMTKQPKAFLSSWFQNMADFFYPLTEDKNSIPKKYAFLFLFNNDLDVYLNQLIDYFFSTTKDEHCSIEDIKRELFKEIKEFDQTKLHELKKLFIDEELINNKPKLFDCFYKNANFTAKDKEEKSLNENEIKINERNIEDVSQNKPSSLAEEGFNFASDKYEVFSDLESGKEFKNEISPAENANAIDVETKQQYSQNQIIEKEKEIEAIEKEFEAEQESLKEYFLDDDSKDQLKEAEEDENKLRQSLEKINEAENLIEKEKIGESQYEDEKIVEEKITENSGSSIENVEIKGEVNQLSETQGSLFENLFKNISSKENLKEAFLNINEYKISNEEIPRNQTLEEDDMDIRKHVEDDLDAKEKSLDKIEISDGIDEIMDFEAKVTEALEKKEMIEESERERKLNSIINQSEINSKIIEIVSLYFNNDMKNFKMALNELLMSPNYSAAMQNLMKLLKEKGISFESLEAEVIISIIFDFYNINKE